MKKIFKQSIDLFGEDVIRREVKEVRIDTLVQEKNIASPIDIKPNEKVIKYCKRIACNESIKLKRTYTMGIKMLKHPLRFAKKSKNIRKQYRAHQKLHNIALKIYYDLVNQISPAQKQAYIEILTTTF